VEAAAAGAADWRSAAAGLRDVPGGGPVSGSGERVTRVSTLVVDARTAGSESGTVLVSPAEPAGTAGAAASAAGTASFAVTGTGPCSRRSRSRRSRSRRSRSRRSRSRRSPSSPEPRSAVGAARGSPTVARSPDLWEDDGDDGAMRSPRFPLAAGAAAPAGAGAPAGTGAAADTGASSSRPVSPWRPMSAWRSVAGFLPPPVAAAPANAAATSSGSDA
jgi:hypothetical protein